MNYNNYSTILEKKLEKNIEGIVRIFKNKTKLTINSKIEGAYLRALSVSALNSETLLKLHKDFYLKSIKKNYYFSSYELFLLGKIFCKKFNIKTNIKISKIKIIFNFFKSILKIIYWSIIIKINFLKKNHKKNKNYFFFINLKDKSKLEFKNFINLRFMEIDKIFLFKNSSDNVFKKIMQFKYNIFKYRNYFEINFKYLAFRESLLKLSPNKILFIEGDSADHELISEISKNLNTKTYSFQWGAFVNRNIKFGFKKMSHNYFLAWSNSYSNILKKYNKFTKFISVGSPLIKKIKPRDKILFLMHPQTSFVSEEENYQLYDLLKQISKKFKNKVIVRYHPKSKDRFDLPNTIEHDPNKISLIKSLEHSFCCVSVRTSSILEAARIGVIPVLLRKNYKVYEDNILLLKNINSSSLIFDDNVNALQFITKLSNNKTLRNKFSKSLITKYVYAIKFIGNRSKHQIRRKIQLL